MTTSSPSVFSNVNSTPLNIKRTMLTEYHADQSDKKMNLLVGGVQLTIMSKYLTLTYQMTLYFGYSLTLVNSIIINEQYCYY